MYTCVWPILHICVCVCVRLCTHFMQTCKCLYLSHWFDLTRRKPQGECGDRTQACHSRGGRLATRPMRQSWDGHPSHRQTRSALLMSENRAKPYQLCNLGTPKRKTLSHWATRDSLSLRVTSYWNWGIASRGLSLRRMFSIAAGCNMSHHITNLDCLQSLVL